MVICPNSTGMVPGLSPTKIVQMVLIGCICRSRGQKIGFQNAIFKNLLVWNYKFTNIWWTALVVLCKWLHLDPWPLSQVSDLGPFGPSCFTFIRYILYYMQIFVCKEVMKGALSSLQNWRRVFYMPCKIEKTCKIDEGGLSTLPKAWGYVRLCKKVRRVFCPAVILSYISF